MEVDDVQCKFPRLARNNVQKMDEQYNQDEEEEGENKRGSTAAAADLGGGIGRFYGWPSSRIVRVSRASGGKDRHSKVLTSKGLRDRRVRLSVNTAIQFYDLQDRLGCDQPSKAVEWLLKAAASSIDELPPINTPFPDTPRQLVSDDKRSSTSDHQLGFDSAEVEDMAPNYNQQQLTYPSACSSNSETSKGSSGLSLSRSESRVKARERAKERVAAEKEKERDNVAANLNPISQTTSFTELLSAGINGPNCSIHRNGGATNESLFFQKSPSRHWSSSTTPMDYFSTGLLGPQVTRQMNMANPALFSIDHQPELQQFSFVPDHLVSVVNSSNNNNNHNNGGGSEYNLNFTISSSSSSAGLAGYNRGTLQSNSPLPHHLHRFHYPPMDGNSSPQSTFFIGTTAPPHVENNNNHHPFLSGYDNHSNNGNKPSGQKGKGKN